MTLWPNVGEAVRSASVPHTADSHAAVGGQ